MLPAEPDKAPPNAAPYVRRARPLVLRLIVLCAAILLPAYGFMAVLLAQYITSARTESERAAIENARDIGEAIDHDIASLSAILQTLSFATPIDMAIWSSFIDWPRVSRT